ncbi:hypothetical protein [Hymenobacter chitinivorans]|uniref:Uncharacterized protein n=1 Tax=Hymenobacter chitinivorans DSM 11115 TaxID=1121954 RepID=A0A2M9BQB1_9BACT|nr:hypothetical protein [Hymenobacter chitinivorans]PJJ60098.1 hypothetical protein CLV45_1523 [Hymenobacter chitinivorans DSM 11115]
MALDLSFLTTRAECDDVLAALAAELASYQNRDTNLDYADFRTEQGQTKVKALLIGVEAEILGFTNLLATPGISASLRKQNETKLRKATDRRDNLKDVGGARSGPARVLSQVDVKQIDKQIEVLTEAQAEVTAHRATLAA